METERQVRKVERDFVPCGWCGGGSISFTPGCAACFNAREKKSKELDEEYARQFPNGPEPIFTARRDSPQEMATLKKVFGRDALEKAFGEGGRGMDEVMENLEREKASLPKETK